MSKAASKRIWNCIKNYDKGTVGFYRGDIPYCVFSIAEWTYMISNPIIIGKDPNAKRETGDETSDGGYFAGHA